MNPPLAPDDRPTPAEFARLAERLLGELSRDDPQVADRMRELGLDPPSRALAPIVALPPHSSGCT